MGVALVPGTRVHIVGVAGAGMSGLARLLLEMGCVVSGSDAAHTEVLDELETLGVTTSRVHAASNLVSSDVVLWSPAVSRDNVELLEAKRRGATLLTRGEVLRDLAAQQRVIGFTGTHGKTTATSLMVHVRRAAGVDDSRLLGAAVTGIGANGHYGPQDLILEIDESYGTFALLAPFALGVLNIEADHLDHYGTLENLESAFGALIERTTGPVVVWGDDEGARRVASRASRDALFVGTTDSLEWRVRHVELARQRASFELVGDGGRLDVELGVTGLHNVANAAVVAVVAKQLGVPDEALLAGLAAFHGAPRRFQFLRRWGTADVYEDYAHLPGEISATVRAARSAGYATIAAVFQPHRVTRTTSLVSSFASAFEGAREVIVTDIYDAGEPNPLGITGEIVADAIREANDSARVVYAATFSEVHDQLERICQDCDVILLLGAGDIATAVTSLIEGHDA
ncbi:MAG: UDP-N-acetylmuramate--L-alanine ligase [Acidimicrobiales bacterium]